MMRRMLCLVCLTGCLLTTGLTAQESHFSKAVNRHMQTLTSDSSEGVAILVALGDSIYHRQSYGLANVTTARPLTCDMTFRIGSVSKQFTAAAILKLVEAGALTLQDRLYDYYPLFPKADSISIYQLLTHTSGIRSYTDDPGFIFSVTRPCNADSLVEAIWGKPYDFEPGTDWHYNNSGYFLLGRIIESKTGMPLGDYLTEQFFTPLGMTRTGTHSPQNRPANEATGHSFLNDQLRIALDWNMDWAGGAGALYSTVDDLHTWALALISGKVLPPHLLEAAWTPAHLSNGEPAETRLGGHYGFGFLISDYNGHRRISHGGGLHGFLTDLTIFPDLGLIIVVLGNCSPPHKAIPGQIANAVTETWFTYHQEPESAGSR